MASFFLVLMTLIPLIGFPSPVSCHIGGGSIFGRPLKIPARNVYEVHEGHEGVKNKKDVLKKDDTREDTELTEKLRTQKSGQSGAFEKGRLL